MSEYNYLYNAEGYDNLMNEFEVKQKYLSTLEKITLLARSSLTLDMEWFMGELDKIGVFGQMLSPELHRKTIGDMAKVKKIAEAVRGFQRAVRNVDVITET